MKTVALLSLLICLRAIPATSGERHEEKITIRQTEALVLAALNPQQRHLPKVGAEQYDAPPGSRFLFFTAYWEGRPTGGSMVLGTYAVDPYTGDVFSASSDCYEYENKRLRALQSASSLIPPFDQVEIPATENEGSDV